MRVELLRHHRDFIQHGVPAFRVLCRSHRLAVAKVSRADGLGEPIGVAGVRVSGRRFGDVKTGNQQEEIFCRRNFDLGHRVHLIDKLVEERRKNYTPGWKQEN